jgi:Ca2+-binding RTX toxin-like protein
MSFRKTNRTVHNVFEPIESRRMMAADLSIRSIDMPEQICDTSQTFTASVTIRNNGDKPVAAGAALRLTLTEDDQVRNGESKERPLGIKTLPSQLKPKQTYTFQVNLRGSAQPTGTFRLGAEIDSNNAVSESNEANNVAVSAPMITYARFLPGQTITGTDGKDSISITSKFGKSVITINGQIYVEDLNQWPYLTINTGKGNDRITTTSEYPVQLRVNAGAGHDTVIGGAANDEISGGTGNDRLYGSGGNDTLYGSGGHDRLYGDAGNDQLYAGSGNDRLYGGTGSDVLSGSGGKDIGQSDVDDLLTSIETTVA